MTDKLPPLPLSIIRTVHGKEDCYTAGQMRKYAAAARAQALEEAARVCDVTPPHPFRPSIEAAHAIRALKDTP